MKGRTYAKIVAWLVTLAFCLVLTPWSAQGQSGFRYKLTLPGVVSYELNLPDTHTKPRPTPLRACVVSPRKNFSKSPVTSSRRNAAPDR